MFILPCDCAGLILCIMSKIGRLPTHHVSKAASLARNIAALWAVVCTSVIKAQYAPYAVYVVQAKRLLG